MLTDQDARTIYREAIDRHAADKAHDDSWWEAVVAEMRAVVEAGSADTGASVIAWWHSEDEWRQFRDSPKRAARRILTSARRVQARRVGKITR